MGRVPGNTRALALKRAEHCQFKRLLPLRSVTRGGQKAERKNSIRLHGGKSAKHQFLADRSGLQVSQVAQQGECTEPALGEQPFPNLALGEACIAALFAASGAGESNLPCVGRGKPVLGKTPPQRGLRLIHWASVGEEQHVAQTHGAGTVVLG